MATNWAFPVAFRYFECVVPAQNIEKFWGFRVWRESSEASGVQVTCWWGRIGTAGDSLPKTFATLAAAERYAEAKVAEKLRKGYQTKDEAWVKRMWQGWRPPFAVTSDRPWPAIAPSRQPAPAPVDQVARATCRHSWVDVSRIGTDVREQLCTRCNAKRRLGTLDSLRALRPIDPGPQPPASVKMNPGRVQRSKPILVAQPPKRVIDFTED